MVREESSLQADETKDIAVVVHTAFTYGFSAVPNYYEYTGEIAFVNLVYTIKNIYQPLPRIRATLRVSLDSELLEEEIISLPTLDVGSIEGSYKMCQLRGGRAAPIPSR